MRTLLALSFVAIGACRQTPTQPSIVPEPSNQSTSTSSNGVTGQSDAVRGPHVVVRAEGRPPLAIPVEVARTEDEQNRGLMHHHKLAANAGMIFVFRRVEQHTFWMRNTFLPLDMIFIKPDRRVLGVVENATPMTDDPRQVEGESQYVLEVNAGFASRNGIRTNTVMEFVNITSRARLSATRGEATVGARTG